MKLALVPTENLTADSATEPQQASAAILELRPGMPSEALADRNAIALGEAFGRTVLGTSTEMVSALAVLREAYDGACREKAAMREEMDRMREEHEAFMVSLLQQEFVSPDQLERLRSAALLRLLMQERLAMQKELEELRGLTRVQEAALLAKDDLINKPVPAVEGQYLSFLQAQNFETSQLLAEQRCRMAEGWVPQAAYNEMHADSERLRSLVNTDELTGLLNRRGYFHDVGLVMDVERREHLNELVPHTFLFFDLNHLKTVNDKFGHSAGDALLCLFAKKLKRFFRNSDVVARLGGDEFLVCLTNTDEQEAMLVAQKFLDTLADVNFSCQGQVIPVEASIGVANNLKLEVFDPQTLAAHADAAMYTAKAVSHQNGGSAIAVFNLEDASQLEKLAEVIQKNASHSTPAAAEDVIEHSRR